MTLDELREQIIALNKNLARRGRPPQTLRTNWKIRAS
jgi:hypothetical protein